MRILVVTHRYPPYGSAGVERVAEQTAQGLRTAGHDVLVLTREPLATPALPRIVRDRRDGVRVVTLRGGGTSLERFPGRAIELERLFERTLLEFAPAVVVISHLIDHSPAYVSIAHRWEIPVVVEMHDFYLACERAHLERHGGDLCSGPEGGRACATHCFPHQPFSVARWALRTHMFRQAVQEADALICPSGFVAEQAARLFGLKLPRLFVIGNGVTFAPQSLQALEPARGSALRLACIGAVIPHKGPHVVIEALRLARLPDVELTLFGLAFHPYVGTLLRAAHGIPNLRLRCFGTFAPQALPALLGNVDLVVMASLVPESYGLVVREALACGIPVVASRVGALPEAVRDGENGRLFSPGSSRELAAILQQSQEDPALLPRLRAGIRATDWLSTAERVARLEDVIAATLDQAAPREDPAEAELTILRNAIAS